MGGVLGARLAGVVAVAAVFAAAVFGGDERAASQPAGASQPERRSWWFPWFATTGTQQTFRARVEDRVSRQGKFWRTDREEITFDVQVFAAEGETCLIKLLPPKEAEANSPVGLAEAWIRGWSAANADGLLVTRDRVSVRGADVFRGPLREGDRFTMGGFAAIYCFVYCQMVGFSHFEVTETGPQGVSLRFEFWAGENGPNAM